MLLILLQSNASGNTAPIVTPRAAISGITSGTLVTVSATATDDGSVASLEPSSSPPLTFSGTGGSRTFIAPLTLLTTQYTITWTATDNLGLTGTATQIATVLAATQRVVAGGVEVAARFQAPVASTYTPNNLRLAAQGLWLQSNGVTYGDPWGKTTSITAKTGRTVNSIASDIVMATALGGAPLSIHVRYERTRTATNAGIIQGGGLLLRTAGTADIVMASGFTRTLLAAMPVDSDQHVVAVVSTSGATTGFSDGAALTATTGASTGTFGTTLTVGNRVDGTIQFPGNVLEVVIGYGLTAQEDLNIHNYLISATANNSSAPLYHVYTDNDIVQRSAFTQQVQNTNKSYSATVASNKTSLERFEVRSGDEYNALGTERSELSGPSLANGKDIWISMMLVVEPGTSYATWNIMGQIHGSGSTSPVFAQEYENGNYVIRTRHDRGGPGVYTSSVRYTMPLVRGQAYNIVHHVVAAKTGDGRVETWIDGNKVVDYTGPIGYNLEGTPYWKHGVYRSPATPPVAVVYGNVEVQMGGTLFDRVEYPLPDPRIIYPSTTLYPLE